MDRTSEQFFARTGYQFAPATRIGLEASAGLTRYSSDIQTDNNNVSVGPFLEWQITEAVNVGLRGGYVFYDFQGSAATGPGSTLSSYYTGAEIRHQLTESISHGLAASHGIQQGFNQGDNILSTRV